MCLSQKLSPREQVGANSQDSTSMIFTVNPRQALSVDVFLIATNEPAGALQLVQYSTPAMMRYAFPYRR